MVLATAPNKLWLPSLQKEIERPWFLPSAQLLKEQRELLSKTFFLVRQGDTFGERLRCVRCNRRHDYITLMCIEQPFSGMAGGLYAYYRVIADNKLEGHLRPEELSRYRAVTQTLSTLGDLGKMHPETARRLAKMESLKVGDEHIGACAFGILEGIATVHAKKLEDKINLQGIRPRFKLGEGTGEVYRPR